MAVDFSSLLNKPTDDIKRPPSLPAGSYFGIIEKHAFDESREKKTPYVSYTVKLTGEYGEDVDLEAVQGIEISKRTMRKDFYLTEDALWRLKEFLESCNIPMAGRSLGETIPEAVNCRVLCEVSSQLDRRDPEAPPRNQIEKMVGNND